MPIFNGKSKKFELFENQFRISIKVQNHRTVENKLNFLYSVMHRHALQTFNTITSPNKESLEEISTVSIKCQSIVTAKHKFQQLVFNPAEQKLNDFSNVFQKLSKDAFGAAAQAIIEQFTFAKMPPHLKKLKNQAHLEVGTYKQIVSQLEK